MEYCMKNDDLLRQLDFLYEVDKIKHIVRKTKLFDESRFENDAEHSWTICLMAVLFRQYSDTPLQMERVLTMLLIHDIVEVDAGDVFLYAAERDDVAEKEEKAAERLFGLLPEAQAKEFLALWHEFEQRQTPEALFASAFDRLEPLLQNYKNKGFTWKQHHITKSMVLKKNAPIKDGSAFLGDFYIYLVNECVKLGYLADD